jgi:hypothetical protein
MRPDLEGGARSRAVAAPLAAVAGGVAVLAGATAGMLQGLEPFATWYYPFAWYATLLAADGWIALRGGPGVGAGSESVPGATGRGSRFLLFGRPAYLATLLVWSAVVWLFFESLNFRLRNWHYVFVPEDPLARWAGIVLSFATVLPAVFVAEALLERLGVGRAARAAPLHVTPALLRNARLAGALMLALPLLWPRTFFALVWLAPALLLEPGNYRRDPRRSLLGDLERGRPGRLLRLLLGGATIGLLWELYNVQARGKWIYTVPGFEELKLFEMPLLGFLGFPPFALACFAMWQALVLAGLAVPRWGWARSAPRALRAGAALAALLFTAAVLVGMERRTISSYSPRLADLRGAPAAGLEGAGFDVFSLAEASPARVADLIAAAGDAARSRSGVPHELEARRWIESARLAALRGIGTRNLRRLEALGIHTVRDLAAADPAVLARRLAAAGGEEVLLARVQLWVRAARREAARTAAWPELTALETEPSASSARSGTGGVP